MTRHVPRKEDIRSESFMCELFGCSTDKLHQLAKENGWSVAVISQKIRLYDITDAQRMFVKYS